MAECMQICSFLYSPRGWTSMVEVEARVSDEFAVFAEEAHDAGVCRSVPEPVMEGAARSALNIETVLVTCSYRNTQAYKQRAWLTLSFLLHSYSSLCPHICQRRSRN